MMSELLSQEQVDGAFVPAGTGLRSTREAIDRIQGEAPATNGLPFQDHQARWNDEPALAESVPLTENDAGEN